MYMINKRILIAGGGTGGHLFPALAIGEEIQRRDSKAKIQNQNQNLKSQI